MAGFSESAEYVSLYKVQFRNCVLAI